MNHSALTSPGIELKPHCYAATSVTRIRDASAHPLPVLPRVEDRSEHTTALIVITLSLACTVLAIYDLFLLAAGV